MKRIFRVLLVIIVSFISFKCQKELTGYNTAVNTHDNTQSSPLTATLQGNIYDSSGAPAAGVKISAGSKITNTNSHGYFRIADAQLDKNASLVTAELPGYFKAYRSFRATSGVNQVVIELRKKILAGTVNASTGGTVLTTNNGKVSLPANSVIKATGGNYSGVIKVYAAYIDPTSREIGKSVPGSFMADDRNNKRVVLSSYGMLAVELESAAGEKLQLAEGNRATLTVPIPSSSLSAAPASIPLWYMDEQTGIWKEEGTAQKSGNAYTGTVKHFSYWNCDISFPSVGFSAIIKTSDGMRLTNTNVSVQTITDSALGYAHGYTDSVGQVSGLIPANTALRLNVYDQCYNVIYSKNIGPFGSNTDLGEITIPNSMPYIVNVKGKLLSCANKPVLDGYAIIYQDNLVSYIRADAGGNFSTNIITCAGVPATVQVLGVDAAAQQQGSLLTIPVNQRIADAGNVIACGVSSAQFINYKVDGVSYTMLSPVDSMTAFTIPQTIGFTSLIQGYKTMTNQLHFDFTGEAAAGIYPVKTLSVAAYSYVGVVKPFNVVVTAFPEHAGEFYEGNFSGNFIDSSAVLVKHRIECIFRVKKY